MVDLLTRRSVGYTGGLVEVLTSAAARSYGRTAKVKSVTACRVTNGHASGCNDSHDGRYNQ